MRETGAGILLGNTYHLLLRPGAELLEKAGGLHRFMRWDGPILTDSGGFQVFSLGHLNKIGEDGVVFKNPLNGDLVDLTPERSIATQHAIGSDILMAFDDCPPAGGEDPVAARERSKLAMDRTHRWLDRCVKFHRESGRDDVQALFGIVQGGTSEEDRAACVEAVCSHDLPGYAIGGVAVGEDTAAIDRIVAHTAPLMPADKPRYLMGVGYPRDIVAAVRAGVDLFDCVLPTRHGRSGHAFTAAGPMKLKNAPFREDFRGAGGGLRLPGLRGRLHAGLPAPPRQVQRDARRGAADAAQPAAVPAADGGRCGRRSRRAVGSGSSGGGLVPVARQLSCRG